MSPEEGIKLTDGDQAYEKVPPTDGVAVSWVPSRRQIGFTEAVVLKVQAVPTTIFTKAEPKQIFGVVLDSACTITLSIDPILQVNTKYYDDINKEPTRRELQEEISNLKEEVEYFKQGYNQLKKKIDGITYDVDDNFKHVTMRLDGHDDDIKDLSLVADES